MRSAFAWLAFVVAASVPTVVLGVVTSRAAEAEAARTRDAARDARIAAAESVTRDLEAWTARAREAIVALPKDGEPRSLARILARTKAPFADVFATDATGTLVIPTATAPRPPESAACRDARTELTTGAREKARATILAQCPELRSDGGRFLFPLLALESTSGEVPPAEGGLVVPWLERHGAELGATERDVLGKRIEVLGARMRDEARRALRTAPNAGDAIRAVLDGARSPAFGGAGERVASAGSQGIVVGRTEDDGSRVGFVVHAGSLAALPSAPGTRADLRSFALAPGPGDEGAIVRGSPSFVMHVVDADPAATEARVRASARNVVLHSCEAALVTIGLAAFLFVRARRAERLAELRTDFVAAVSHELRTPLASARMLAELLESGAVPEDERAEVERTLAGETRRLARTLDRMLRFGALSRGKLTAVLAPVDARELLEGAAKRLCAVHPDVGITLECATGLAILADADLLGLAVDNLLSNAAKYAAEGGPFVVRAIREGDDVAISVADRGPGLDAKARARVFEPFERVDARLSKATEGTGIGLSLVRGIARAHGGDATVVSAPGEGATFVLRFPATMPKVVTGGTGT